MVALLDGSLRADKPVRTHLAFFFADVRDFSGLTLTLQPEPLYAALNRYYQQLVGAIHRHNGTIDNFRGDGLMAFFGAPQALANPAREAVLAAQDAQAAIARLNQDFVGEGLPPMRVAIGLAWGEAVVGPVGAAERNNYTALGHAANVAAHLQTLSKSEDGVVFATDELVHNANEGSWREVGPRLMKGRLTANIFALKDTPEGVSSTGTKGGAP
jgi:adenylate cyclase